MNMQIIYPYFIFYLKEGNRYKKTIFREIRRYNQFPLVVNKDRIIAYNKLCYKVKYDMDDILFFIQIGAPNKKNMNLILSQYIIQKEINYISLKHYGKL